jgi:hypothetical protein
VVLLVLSDVFNAQSHANAQQLLFGTSTAFESTNENSRQIDDSLLWSNSLFLSAGWGTPQGFRSEIGYNFGSHVSLGVSFGLGDSWSRNPREGSVAILGSLRFPIRSSPITPYLLLCAGQEIASPDEYILVYLGAVVPLKPWMQCHVESGFDFTFRYISGGKDMWTGQSEPQVYQWKTRLGINLSFEFDVARIF